MKRLILTLTRDPAIVVRTGYGMLLYGLGLLWGLFVRQGRPTGRPRIAFQSYAVHQALFYESLIQRLLRDDCVDVFFTIWPHPQLPWSEQRRLQEVATSRFGLDPSRVLPHWRVMWWRFDLTNYSDVLGFFPLRRARTCMLGHGAALFRRNFQKLGPRRSVYDFDFVITSGTYDRDLIVANSQGRKIPRIYPVGLPAFDKYFRPEVTRRQYLSGLGLDDTRPVVLYAPHFSEVLLPGNKGARFFEDVLRELAKLAVHVIVKPHAMLLSPGAVSGSRWQHVLLQAETAQVKVDFAPEDVFALHAADVLITGISSRAFNFMLLDKPVVLYSGTYVPEDSFARERYRLMCQGSAVADSLAALIADVQDALLHPEACSEARRRVATALFSSSGDSTGDVANIIYREIGLGGR
jgi:CDP-glycerol glycerophosphotransferase (TagB/SpsB family)